MITSALDMFTAPGTAVATSGDSGVIVNGYNNNSVCDTLFLVVHQTAGTDTVGVKLQTSWDGTTFTDVVDFGNVTADENGYLVKCKLPKGKPVLGKFLKLRYTITGNAGDTVLGAFLTFGIDEDAADVVANPAFNAFGKDQPTV